MKIPDIPSLEHIAPGYDANKAHEYYLRTRKLKGRKKGSAQPTTSSRPTHRSSSARAKQRQALQARIQNLEQKLQQLQALIRTKTHEEASDNRKSKAKKERAAKEKDKPKSVAEKAQIARDNEKYRDKHKQELKTKAKTDSGKSDGGASKSKTSDSEPGLSDLTKLATKVRGQIAVAKQKLAAL